MKIFFINLLCTALLLNSWGTVFAEVVLPPLLISGQKEKPVSLVLGQNLLIRGEEENKIILDASVKSIRLFPKSNDFGEELLTLKKYRYQYAMFASIIFAGLFFTMINK